MMGVLVLMDLLGQLVLLAVDLGLLLLRQLATMGCFVFCDLMVEGGFLAQLVVQ